MAAEAFVNHVPTMMGGVGARDVAEFIGHWPEDTEIIPVDRTIGADKIVNEMILSFTHDIQMDAFLPGVPPTGRAGATSRGRGDGVRQRQSGVRAGLLGSGLALAQVGLLDGSKPPVTGAVQAETCSTRICPLMSC
jgi:carboxymethylenebutenolidase